MKFCCRIRIDFVHFIQKNEVTITKSRYQIAVYKTCITTTDDQNIFTFCKFIWNFGKVRIQQRFCYLSQEIYCEIDSFCIPSRNFDVSWIGCSAGKDDAVELFQKFFCFDLLSYVYICNEFNSLFFHKMNSSVNNSFVQLHVRDTVAEKSAYTVFSFKYSYTVASSV